MGKDGTEMCISNYFDGKFHYLHCHRDISTKLCLNLKYDISVKIPLIV